MLAREAGSITSVFCHLFFHEAVNMRLSPVEGAILGPPTRAEPVGNDCAWLISEIDQGSNVLPF